MANMEKTFYNYYQRIKLSSSKEEELRRGRDALRNRIKSWFVNHGGVAPKFCWQGSFAMKTAINLLGDGQNYDIDDGVYLLDYMDSIRADQAHGWVMKAVDGHTQSISNKNTCVRVNYSAGYHIDLPIYILKNGDAYLAHRTNGWILSDPKAFKDWFVQEVKNNGEQLRRIVLYLKGWKTYCNIPLKGIEITILVGNCYQEQQREDIAVYYTVSKIIETLNTRFSCIKPVLPYEDLFADISESRKNHIMRGLYDLKKSLLKAQSTQSNIEASNILKAKFGSQF